MHASPELPTAPPPCPRQALPLAARQPAQLAAQLLERVRSHGLPLATDDGEAHRPIERGQVTRLQPPRLTLLKAQPHHPHPLLHLVVHGHSVAIQVDGRGKRFERATRGLGYQFVYVERHPRVDEGVP